MKLLSAYAKCYKSMTCKEKMPPVSSPVATEDCLSSTPGGKPWHILKSKLDADHVDTGSLALIVVGFLTSPQVGQPLKEHFTKNNSFKAECLG